MSDQAAAISVKRVLDIAYEKALGFFYSKKDIDSFTVNDQVFKNLIRALSEVSERNSSVFNNILTGLAVKVAFPDLDVRYHQPQIQQHLGAAWFSHRRISENVVYQQFLNVHNFNGAKSGWQTRTLERPKPYNLAFDENIQHVKDEFLEFYDCLVKLPAEILSEGLDYLILIQIQMRESKKIDLATPNVDEISQIVSHLSAHFHYNYSGGGSSRLPVLAIYAVLQIAQKQTKRYINFSLLPLKEHSAADSQTGSAGDIEFVEDSTGELVEALEVKHNIQITDGMIRDCESKIAPFQLQRYFILTTHKNCKPSIETIKLLNQIKTKIGCQVIVNGVEPTIEYYLRLFEEPQEVYKLYVSLLQEDAAITHEHRLVWNEIIMGSK